MRRSGGMMPGQYALEYRNSPAAKRHRIIPSPHLPKLYLKSDTVVGEARLA